MVYEIKTSRFSLFLSETSMIHLLKIAQICKDALVADFQCAAQRHERNTCEAHCDAGSVDGDRYPVLRLKTEE
jgi:hypothetical protein